MTASPAFCRICRCKLDNPRDPLLSANCGGDCRLCMAVVANDPTEVMSVIHGLKDQRDELLHAVRSMLTATDTTLPQNFPGHSEAYLRIVARPRALVAVAKVESV